MKWLVHLWYQLNCWVYDTFIVWRLFLLFFFAGFPCEREQIAHTSIIWKSHHFLYLCCTNERSVCLFVLASVQSSSYMVQCNWDDDDCLFSKWDWKRKEYEECILRAENVNQAWAKANRWGKLIKKYFLCWNVNFISLIFCLGTFLIECEKWLSFGCREFCDQTLKKKNLIFRKTLLLSWSKCFAHFFYRCCCQVLLLRYCSNLVSSPWNAHSI